MQIENKPEWKQSRFRIRNIPVLVTGEGIAPFTALPKDYHERSCRCHDPLPRETGWYPGEEGPCTCSNCTHTPWCGQEFNTEPTEWDGQNDLNQMMEEETTQCDWCNRYMPNDKITGVGPSYTEPNGEVHQIDVLAMCIDREDCEAHMETQDFRMKYRDDIDEVPF